MDTDFPLFPLRAVLLPGGRMPLQIFEPRYLDLISRCMRTDGSFGIVRITRGSEVMSTADQGATECDVVGTEARIVDWDALPHNRLRITIEGARRFRLLDTRQGAQGLLLGDVAWISESSDNEHESDEYDEMVGLLQTLQQHPLLKELGVSADVKSGCLAWTLAQYLPLDDDRRYELLIENDGYQRIQQIQSLLKRLGGEPD